MGVGGGGLDGGTACKFYRFHKREDTRPHPLCGLRNLHAVPYDLAVRLELG